jgi:hypothetical protein
MITLLIDTCSWKQLVSKIEFSKELRQIHSWALNKEVVFLCPEVLAEEWQKHREHEIKEITKAQTRHEKHLKLYQVPLATIQRQVAKELLESQIQAIDEIFNLSVKLVTSEEVKARTFDYRKDRKAPFHVKVDSDKDAALIFSTLDHVAKNEPNRLVFLSDNHNDFTSSVDIDSLHPDILADYLNVSVKYFRKPESMVDFLLKEERLTTIRYGVDIAPRTPSSGILISIDKSIVDQLDEYLNRRYDGIEFYPVQFLKNDFPFRERNSDWLPYRIFTLTTDNAVLFEFLKSLKFSDSGEVELLNPLFKEGVTDFEGKVKRIIRRLNNNLIFHVQEAKGGDKVDIRLNDSTQCPCIRCALLRFDFKTVFENCNPTDGDQQEDLLKKAYINYQCGNFLRANEILERIASWAEENSKYSSLFIARYNQVKLKVFIESHYTTKELPDGLIHKLESINLQELTTTVSTRENDKFIDWLVKGTFFNDAMLKLQLKASDIRDNFQTQSGGGTSSNLDVWELINEFCLFDSFLNQNFIVYDSFAEHFSLMEVLEESLIASHAIPESQGSKLNYFDDYLIKKIVYYGEPKDIRKFLRRYGLTTIQYKTSSNTSDTFLATCSNFFDSARETNETFLSFCEKNHNFFWQKYNRVFSNIVVMLQVLKLDSNSKNVLIKKLVSFLAIEERILDPNLEHVRALFWQVKDTLDEETRRDVVNLFLSKKKYHSSEWFNLLSAILESTGVSDLDFDRLTSLYFKECEICGRQHNFKSIVYFHKDFNESQRLILRSKVEERLKSKFDYDLYYRSVLFEILDNDGALFAEFYKKSIPSTNSPSIGTLFGREGQRFEQVNMLINLCFKLEIDLKQSIFDPIRTIDPYYEWLLDVDNFDYSKFNPLWVKEYETLFYIERYRSSENLRKALVSFLDVNQGNLTVHKAYFKIYVKAS